ncbi:hypothetical protein [Candidatus Reidiella endopervernicosa]|nr:hypothetical protein [Candidatus Reidiella endopervernicosa]
MNINKLIGLILLLPAPLLASDSEPESLFLRKLVLGIKPKQAANT